MTTKAIVFTGPGKVIVKKIRLPELRDEDILIRTEYSAISAGTEKTILTGLRGTFPCVPGYQSLGIVEKTSRKVKTIEVGQRVLLGCSRLPEGLNYGAGSAHIAYGANTYRMAVKVDDGILPEEAVFSWVAGCSLQGIERTGINKDDLVVIIGQGLIGQMSAQLARIYGAGKVVVSDVVESRLKISRQLGADIAVNPQQDNLERIVKQNKKEGADVVIECTGNKKLIDPSLRLLRSYGRFCYQGWYPGKASFTYDVCHGRQISMHFPCAWGETKGLKTILKLLARQKLKIKPLITHRFKYNNGPQAYRLLLKSQEEALGVLIDWK